VPGSRQNVDDRGDVTDDQPYHRHLAHPTLTHQLRVQGSSGGDTTGTQKRHMRREEEASLIAAVRAGDRGAFETLYRAYWPALVKFARRIGGLAIEDAKELVQDVFLSLWRSRERWTVRDGLQQYMYGAVFHRARELGARQRRAIDPPLAYREPTVDNSGPHRPVVRELEERVSAIIAAMPLRCRQIYLLYHADRLDTREIAAALGISIVTVNRHHARALRLLARGLAKTEWAETLAKVLESR
jgi:RNA polymerase sigma-70 factor (ECF subfamily)